MATMYVQGKSLAVVYVDPGAAGANNGTTPTDALTSLPDPDVWAANTVYLCRRGTSNIGMVTGTVTNDNSYVIGMPKASTLFYDEAPAEAKTAWDSDVPNFANLSTSGNTVTFNQNYGGFANIEFHQTGQSTPQILIDSSSSSIHDHILINCRFIDDSYDLTASSAGSTAYTGAIRLFGKNVTIKDCHIERRAENSTDQFGATNQFALELDGNNITIDNVDLWWQTNSASSVGCGALEITNGDNLEIYDLNIKMVDNSGSKTIATSPISIAGNNIKIRNLNTSVDRIIGTFPATQAHTGHWLSIIANQFSGLDIDGVTVDLSVMDWGGSNYFQVSNSAYSTIRGMNSSMVQNVTITPPSTFWSTTIQTKCNISLTGVDTIKDCVFDVGQHNVNIVSSGSNESACNVKNITVGGSLQLQGVPFADITSITRTNIPSNINTSPPINLEDCPGAQIKSLTLPGSWSTENIVEMNLRCTVFIDNMNTELFYTHPGNTYAKSVVYANNINSTPGRWEAHNYSFDASTTSAFRTGGANAAIKFSGQRIDEDDPLWIGRRPFPGIKVTPTATGFRTVTVYTAFKLFSNPDDIREFFRVYVESPIGASDFGSFNSTANGNWKPDTSTWNNDSGLTIRKCDIKVQVDRLEDLEVRVAYSWFTASAYLYFDPLIVFS